MIKKEYFVKFLKVGAVALLASFIWTASLFYSQNNIIFNSHWESYKKNFYGSSAYAIYSLVSRTLVANNQLVTDKNLGHQIIFSQKNFTPGRVLFKVSLKPNSYVDLLFNADESETEGLRFSTIQGAFPFFYKATLKGEFLRKQRLNAFQLKSAKNIEIELKAQDGMIAAYADGQWLGSHSGNFQEAKIGFYTSLEGVVIKKVTVYDLQGKPFVLSFSRDYEWEHFVLWNFLGVLVLIVLINCPYFEFSYQRSLRMASFLFFTGLIWLSFDYFYYSKIPKVWNFSSHVFDDELTSKWNGERLRYLFFREWFRALGGEVATVDVLRARSVYDAHSGIRLCQKAGCQFYEKEGIYSGLRSTNYRIAHIGGSFSDFAGIVNLEDSFFEQFSRDIIERKPSVEIANFAFSGAVFRLKKAEIERTIELYKPQLIVFSIFLDLADYELFSKFLDKWEAAGIPVVFYYPLLQNFNDNFETDAIAFSLEYNKRKKRKQFWSDLKQRKGLSFFETNKMLDQKFKTSGWIWWDSNHMTPFAQKLVAERISSFVLESMK